jgi:hypothetical protein
MTFVLWSPKPSEAEQFMIQNPCFSEIPRLILCPDWIGVSGNDE